MKAVRPWFIAAETLSRKARVGITLFCLPFLAGGVFVLIGGALRPTVQWLLAKQWVRTPAKILHAEVERNADTDGDTFRLNVSYRYEFGGREYRGTRASFAPVGSTNIG